MKIPELIEQQVNLANAALKVASVYANRQQYHPGTFDQHLEIAREHRLLLEQLIGYDDPDSPEPERRDVDMHPTQVEREPTAFFEGDRLNRTGFQPNEGVAA